MTNRILIINGPNLNLLGEREQSQYGSITFDQLKEKCLKISIELNINLDFIQSFFSSSKVIYPYCDCSLSPNRLRFGPLIINILFTFDLIVYENEK